MRSAMKATVSTFGATALILILVLASVFVLFRQDLRRARDRIASIQTGVYSSSYGDIEYRIDGQGPVMLVVHGIVGGIDQGMSMVDTWGHLRGPYTHLYISRFGYGKSSRPVDATARMQSAAYKELLDHLGIDRVFVVGNSAGGPSSMWFAIDYPDRTSGLILLSSAVPGPEPAYMPKLVAKNDFIYWAAVKTMPGTLLKLLVAESVAKTYTAEQRDFIVENAFMAGLPISSRSEGIIFDNEVSLPSVNNVPFDRIKAPTVIFQAVDDPREFHGGRELARRIPNNTFVGLTGGHFLFGHDEEICAAIARLIKQSSMK
ncbi:MAG TPA: hypothetical protein DCK76_03535 [Desulfotomaculum sp.]|nr:hypothetical protein [Desulfotomaculum sp.]HBY04778.1 hypothetical protein [Desulfotomaculum sp.]